MKLLLFDTLGPYHTGALFITSLGWYEVEELIMKLEMAKEFEKYIFLNKY